EPPYTLEDMASDAIAVLDNYEIEQAHVIGRSMGGMITQLLALNYSSRLKTITLIYSSPAPSSANTKEPDLPGPSETFIAAATPLPEGAAFADQVAARVELHRALAGSRHPFDAERARKLTVREMARARNYASNGNHAIAVQNTAPWRDRLGEISLPTLVVHGTEDPILQLPHGEALAKEISGAEMYVMDGVGHALPEPEWDGLIAKMLEHTS
ncbi:MAG: alpha/beta hydrolase, partial [Pseudomonadota bacterium]